ncbi:MAG: hypothetical protein NW237_17240 [Cyanobacteriota bacterium]|nr:hypothetical protein [Cyanobacteriota bacterium]
MVLTIAEIVSDILAQKVITEAQEIRILNLLSQPPLSASDLDALETLMNALAEGSVAYRRT